MAATTDYFTTLKTQLEAQAAAKKNALDLAYERATTAQFDAEGNMSRKAGKGPGTLDVAFDEQQRQLSGGAENAGMLKSGQFGRDLATSQAAYRTAIVSGAAETEAAKTQVTNETASELAKYQAMYTPAAGATPQGGTPAASNISAPAGSNKDPEIDPLPNFNLQQSNLKANTATPNRTDANGFSGMGAYKKPVLPKKTVTKVPVPNKVKTMIPKRIGGY